MKIKPTGAPQRGKLVQARESGTKGPGQEYPAFSLRYLSKDYCITGCSKDAFEKISRKQIRAGIPAHITPDVEFFWAFRFHGNAPMVGYKDGETFHVLWFDEKFTLYDHG